MNACSKCHRIIREGETSYGELCVECHQIEEEEMWLRHQDDEVEHRWNEPIVKE